MLDPESTNLTCCPELSLEQPTRQTLTQTTTNVRQQNVDTSENQPSRIRLLIPITLKPFLCVNHGNVGRRHPVTLKTRCLNSDNKRRASQVCYDWTDVLMRDRCGASRNFSLEKGGFQTETAKIHTISRIRGTRVTIRWWTEQMAIGRRNSAECWASSTVRPVELGQWPI